MMVSTEHLSGIVDFSDDSSLSKIASAADRNERTASGCHVDDDHDSISSQDEALCDVLGLPSLHVISLTEEEEILHDTNNHNHNNNINISNDTVERPLPLKTSMQPVSISSTSIHPVRIKLPLHVSRHFYPPQNCCAWTIPHLFTQQECRQLIETAATDASSQQQSFDYVRTATHTAEDGTQYSVDLQSPNHHKLSVFNHPQWVQRLWRRLQPYIIMEDVVGERSSVLSEMIQRDRLDERHHSVAGLNPRLRVLKYDADDGDEFQPHFDATTTTTTMRHSTSLVTVLLYLNDGGGVDFEGGETVFLPNTLESNPPVDWKNATDVTLTDNANNVQYHDNATIITPSTGTVVLFEHDLFHCGRRLEWGTKYVLRTDIMFQMTLDELQTLRSSRLQKEEEGSPDSSSRRQDTNHSAPITIQELVDKVFATQNDDDDKSVLCADQHGNIAAALSNLGLLEDTTIESFCSPGRFALQAMLQDVLRLKEGNRNETIRDINMLLDAAFNAMKQT
jgi:2OG-Fe(II) oxygenase superfamily